MIDCIAASGVSATLAMAGVYRHQEESIHCQYENAIELRKQPSMIKAQDSEV
jgi:hypothetical protein